MIQRTNIQMELDVSSGIALSLYGGIEAGAKFMYGRGIPISVACRTLLYPELRRNRDPR